LQKTLQKTRRNRTRPGVSRTIVPRFPQPPGPTHPDAAGPTE
jgi:hypothetical protein